MSDTPPFAAKPCPICGKPAIEASRPFCSNRCADVDLHRWFTGQYAVPAVESDEDDLDADFPDSPTQPRG